MNTPIKVTTGKDLPELKTTKPEGAKEPAHTIASETDKPKPFQAAKPHDIKPSEPEKAPVQGEPVDVEKLIAAQRAEFAERKAKADAEEAELMNAHKARMEALQHEQSRQIGLAEKEIEAHRVNHAERIEALRSAAEDELEGVAVKLEAEKNAKVSNPKGRPIPVQESEHRPRHISEIGAGYNGKADTIEEASN